MSSVGVFWDYESCPPPPALASYVVVNNIRKAVQHHGPIKIFRVYLDMLLQTEKSIPQHQLQSSGISLIHAARSDKECTRNMMLVDLMLFAVEASEPATIVLITNSIGSCTYGLSQLRLRGHKVLLASDGCSGAVSREESVEISERLRWREDIHLISTRAEPQTRRPAPQPIVSGTKSSTVPIMITRNEGGNRVPSYEPSSSSNLKRKRNTGPSLTEHYPEHPKRNRTKAKVDPPKPVPRNFKTLVTVLRDLRKKNVHEIMRSQLSRKLLQQNKNVFSYLNNLNKNVTKINRHAQEAFAAGIVELNNGDSEVTVKLHYDYW